MDKEKIIRIIKNIASIIVIIAMFLIIFYQNRDRDMFKFGKDESTKLVESDQTNPGGETYSKSDARSVGDKVIFVTPSSLNVVNTKAEGDKTSIAISNPVLHSQGKYSVIYEVEGKQASVYSNSKLSYSITTDEKIIKAKVNSNGYLILATEKDGYNCESSVYNQSGEAMFKWSISRDEFLDGIVNNNNNALLLSVASSKGDKLYGKLMFIDITDASVLKEHSVESQLFYDVNSFDNDTFAAFGNDSLMFFNSDGNIKWTYKYDGRKLLNADITNPDMMILVFSPKDSVLEGSSSQVVVINRLGKVTGNKTYDDRIEDIAVNDEAVAIAIGKSIVITDNMLKEVKTIKSETAVRKIALFSDNEHVFVIGNSESKILK